MIHAEESLLAGETIVIAAGKFAGQEYVVEDWWDRLMGKSWHVCDNNPACLEYAVRAAMEDMPIDNNVLYGKIGGLGKLIHVNQIEQEA